MPQAASALATQLGRSAESVGLRGGHVVPLRYGSAAGELAVCLRSVGLVDREDLRVLRIFAAPEALDRFAAELVDGGLAGGEAVSIGIGHCGRLGPDQLLAAVPTAAVTRLCDRLAQLCEAGKASVEETELQAIGVIGPATAGLLAELGAYAELAAVNGRGRIVAGEVVWMLLDPHSALALVGPEGALPLWNSLTQAGRRFELGYVGAEAAERFEAIRCRAG